MKEIRFYRAGLCILTGSFILFLAGFRTYSQSSGQERSPSLEVIEAYVKQSNDYIQKNLDSAIYFGELANQMINDLASDSAKANVYINLGTVYRARGNHDLSLDYFFRAETIIDEILEDQPGNMEIFRMKARLFSLLGVNYFFQMNYEKALEYYEEGLKLLEELNEKAPEVYDPYDKIKIYNNLAGVYIRQENYDRAIEYYKTSIDLLHNDDTSVLISSLYNNLGICYMENKVFDNALHNFQKSLEIRKAMDDKRGIAQCYNNISKNYFYQKDYSEALKFSNKALQIGRSIGNLESIRISLQALTQLYDSTQRYEEAYFILKELKSVSDSIYNKETITRISRLEMQHEFDQQQRIFDLEIRRREAETEKKNLIYLVVGGVLFFSLLTAILLIVLQRNKIRHSKLEKKHFELEKKHLNLEKEKLQEDLEFKNRELTTNVMYLLKKNELITNISGKLIRSKLEFKKENQQIIQEIINDLKSGQDIDTWGEFEAYFTQVHTGFYKNLQEQFPNLSANERKLCAFLRLNMSTKDIAAITYQSINSITVARSRLRKKLNIEGEDINLVNFLAQF